MIDPNSIRVVWLSGNFFQRQAVIKKIQKVLGDYSLTLCDEDVSYEYMENEVLRSSCFSDMRMVWVRGWPIATNRQTMMKHFKKLMGSVPDDCVFVLDNLETTSNEFSKIAAKNGKVFEFPEFIRIDSAPNWLSQRMTEKDKSIEMKVAVMLCHSLKVYDKKGVKVDDLVLLLKKISHYLGKRKRISEDEAYDICIDSNDFIVWNLYSKLDAKDAAACLKIVAKLWQFTKDPGVEVIKILNSMIWRYRLLLAVKEGLAHKKSIEAIGAFLEKLPKLNRKGAGYNTRYEQEGGRGKMAKPMYTSSFAAMTTKSFYGKPPAIKCYGRVKIFSILELVEQMIYKIRSGCTDAEAMLMFELLIMTICDKVNEKDWACIRKVHNVNINYVEQNQP